MYAYNDNYYSRLSIINDITLCCALSEFVKHFFSPSIGLSRDAKSEHWTCWLSIFSNRISVIQNSGIWVIHIIHKTPSSCLTIMIMTLWRGRLFCFVIFRFYIFSFQFSPITYCSSHKPQLMYLPYNSAMRCDAVRFGFAFIFSIHLTIMCFAFSIFFIFLYQVHSMSFYLKINDKKRLNSTCTCTSGPLFNVLLKTWSNT